MLHSLLRCAFLATFLTDGEPHALLAQSIHVVPVCAVLGDPNANDGRMVAVSGRLGGTDETIYVHDDCTRVAKVSKDDAEWPPIITLELTGKPPRTDRVADFRAELKTLNSAQEEWHKLEKEQPGRYHVVFLGRIECARAFQLAMPTGRRRTLGYGHLGAARCQLVFNKAEVREIEGVANSPQKGK